MQEFYRLKIAALLHDPPSKPWLIISDKNHEEKAKEIIKQLTGFNEIPGKVREADRLAASIDRYLLSIVMGKENIHGFLPVKELKLKNTINPLFETEIQNVLDEKAEKNYWDELKILSRVGDLRLRYLLLYGLYELLWINAGLPVGPADTRVPTHTVFDHNYATATALNWVYGKGGILVGLDVAGVQEFIRSSRKLRDAWTSSYIVSALLWYTILPLVSQLGPDVAIMPSLRLNPLYHHWLFWELVKQQGDLANVKQELEKVRSLVYLGTQSMYEELQIPPYATLPERAVLLLPSTGLVAGLLGSNVEEGLMKRFERGWKLLWSIARELAKKKVEVASGRRDLCWEFIHKVFETYEKEFRESRFDEVPPLTLRVEVTQIRKSEKDKWRLYSDAYKKLSKIMGLSKYRRLDPAAKLGLDALTEKVFGSSIGYPRRSGKGFEYCTSCGVLPALVVLPAREGRELREDEYGLSIIMAVEGVEAEKIEEYLRALRRGEEPPELKRFTELRSQLMSQLERLKQVFTPGERLCPWCFLKRIIGLEPGILNTLLLGVEERGIEKFISSFLLEKPTEERSFLEFPSVSDVASLRLKERLAEHEEGIIEKIEEARQKNRELVEEELLTLVKAAARRSRTMWLSEKKLIERIEKAPLSEESKMILKGLLLLNPELLWLSSDVIKRNWWDKILGELGVSGYLWKYYGLLIADGDSIGELVEGKPTVFNPFSEREEREKLPEWVRELLVKLLSASGEGDFQKLLKAMIECAMGECSSLDEWAKILSRELRLPRETIDERLKRAKEIIESILSESELPISISYHTALSATLARQALLDTSVIANLGGFVVYAGGDDLLAFLPVDEPLYATYVSRRLFAGADLRESDKPLVPRVEPGKGFVRVVNAYLPALPGVGRSYCVYVAHYLYPLQTVLRRAREALKTAKNSMVLKLQLHGRRDTLYKDFQVIVYSPRGGEEVTAIPLSLSRVTHLEQLEHYSLNYLDGVGTLSLVANDLLRKLKPLTDKPEYSVNLLRDAEEVKEQILQTAKRFADRSEGLDLTFKLFERILQRNSTEKVKRGQKVVWPSLENLVSSEVWRTPFLASWVEHVSEDGRVEEWHLLTSLTRSVRLLRGGMRT